MSENQTTPGTTMVRALFRTIAVKGAAADQPQLSAKIYYPAQYTGSDLEKNTGSLPIVQREGGYPVAVLMPGINVTPEAYAWLAIDLANNGFISICYGWILEEMPGLIALTPGLDISALKPDAYAQRASATALSSVIDALRGENESGLLAGQIDLDNILLGGHSAGGSVALFNARADWFPGLKAAYSYAAHSKASTMLGYDADTVLQLPDQLPTLIMGGSEDGVIAASAFRYGDDGNRAPDSVGPLLRTFEEGLPSNRNDCHLAILRGGNHFSMCWPQDSTTGRPFLDQSETRANEDIRRDMSALIINFAKTHLCQDEVAKQNLNTLLQDQSKISLSRTR